MVAGFLVSGFFIATAATGALILAALAVAGIWVRFGWRKALALTGAALPLALMVSFLGLTKAVFSVTALVVFAATLGCWAPITSR